MFTEHDINAFCQDSSDGNPLHLNDDFAIASGFERRLVPGMLLARMMIPIDQQVTGVHAKFIKPIYPDTHYEMGYEYSEKTLHSEGYYWWGIGEEKHAKIWIKKHIIISEISGVDANYRGNYSVHSPAREISRACSWASYFVGTKFPGHGGILGEVDIRVIPDDATRGAGLSFAVHADPPHEATGAVDISASLKGESGEFFAYCTIQAFMPRTK
jgi:hypothetical protein